MCMKSDKENLEKFFGKIEESDWSQRARNWKENMPWLKYSQLIALEILDTLEKKGITQKAFAEQLNVSPQLINKWLKGKENFTLETIAKIEHALGRKLLKINVDEGPKENVFNQDFPLVNYELIFKSISENKNSFQLDDNINHKEFSIYLLSFLANSNFDFSMLYEKAGELLGVEEQNVNYKTK